MVIKNVEIVYVPDQTSKVLQLATGALDFVWDLPIAAKDSLPPEVKQFTVEVGGANTLYLNMDPKGKAGSKFADARVRQAMSLAINRQAIADTAFAGLVKPLTSFWYDCPDICPTGMLPNGGVQDVEAAKKLMTEAGVPAEGITAEMLVSQHPRWVEGRRDARRRRPRGDRRAPDGHPGRRGDVERCRRELTTSSPSSMAAPRARRSRSAAGSGWLLGHPFRLHQGSRSRQGRRAHRLRWRRRLDVAKRKDLMTQIQTIGTATMPMISLVDRIALDGTRLPDGVLSVANQTPGYIIFQTVAEQAAGKAAGK